MSLDAFSLVIIEIVSHHIFIHWIFLVPTVCPHLTFFTSVAVGFYVDESPAPA